MHIGIVTTFDPQLRVGLLRFEGMPELVTFIVRHGGVPSIGDRVELPKVPAPGEVFALGESH